MGKEWDIFLPFPERRHVDGKYIEPIIEIRPKSTGFNFLFEVSIRETIRSDFWFVAACFS